MNPYFDHSPLPSGKKGRTPGQREAPAGDRLREINPEGRVSVDICDLFVCYFNAPRVTPATIMRLAKTTNKTAGMAVRTLPGSRKLQSMPYWPTAL
jgi:hypothetical protein